jgi:hypothetical protein
MIKEKKVITRDEYEIARLALKAKRFGYVSNFIAMAKMLIGSPQDCRYILKLWRGVMERLEKAGIKNLSSITAMQIEKSADNDFCITAQFEFKNQPQDQTIPPSMVHFRLDDTDKAPIN